MPLYPIDLLNIRDNDSRKQHYENNKKHRAELSKEWQTKIKVKNLRYF